jgi:hypothetical protein
MNGNEIRVSSTSKVSDSLIATGFPYSDFKYLPQFMDSLHYFMKNSHGLRRLGSAATDIAYVALRARRGAPGYDLIASQPSHPWRVGAAKLFTEEYFTLARQSLREGGVFAAWLNGFRIDAESLLAVVNSFERVFEGSLVVDINSKGRAAFLLLGGTRPISLDPERMRVRLDEPRLAALLARHGTGGLAGLLARIEGPGAVFASLAAGLRNTDDNAFVETRTPRTLDWKNLDYAAVDERVPPDTPLLPPSRDPLDLQAVAEALLARPFRDVPWPYARTLERLLAGAGDAIPRWEASLLRARAASMDPSLEANALSELERLWRIGRLRQMRWAEFRVPRKSLRLRAGQVHRSECRLRGSPGRLRRRAALRQ